MPLYTSLQCCVVIVEALPSVLFPQLHGVNVRSWFLHGSPDLLVSCQISAMYVRVNLDSGQRQMFYLTGHNVKPRPSLLLICDSIQCYMSKWDMVRACNC